MAAWPSTGPQVARAGRGAPRRGFGGPAFILDGTPRGHVNPHPPTPTHPPTARQLRYGLTPTRTLKSDVESHASRMWRETASGGGVKIELNVSLLILPHVCRIRQRERLCLRTKQPNNNTNKETLQSHCRNFGLVSVSRPEHRERTESGIKTTLFRHKNSNMGLKNG